MIVPARRIPEICSGPSGSKMCSTSAHLHVTPDSCPLRRRAGANGHRSCVSAGSRRRGCRQSSRRSDLSRFRILRAGEDHRHPRNQPVQVDGASTGARGVQIARTRSSHRGETPSASLQLYDEFRCPSSGFRDDDHDLSGTEHLRLRHGWLDCTRRSTACTRQQSAQRVQGAR